MERSESQFLLFECLNSGVFQNVERWPDQEGAEDANPRFSGNYYDINLFRLLLYYFQFIDNWVSLIQSVLKRIV